MEQSAVLAQVSLLLLQVEPLLLPYADVIAARAELRRFQPNDLLPPPIEGQRQAAYVMEGVFRIFYTDEKQADTTVQLLAEGGVVLRSDGYQYVLNNQAYECEALTPSVLAVWGYEALEYFTQTLPNWHQFAMKANQHFLLKAAAERSEMFNDDATTRYRKFVERYPTIVERVQLRHVASYLGIAPQSLSRIRQQIFQQRKN